MTVGGGTFCIYTQILFHPFFRKNFVRFAIRGFADSSDLITESVTESVTVYTVSTVDATSRWFASVSEQFHLCVIRQGS